MRALKTGFLLLALTLLLVLGGEALGGQNGMILGLAVAACHEYESPTFFRTRSRSSPATRSPSHRNKCRDFTR